MRGQKMLKVFSILMIFVCFFGIAAGAMGTLDLNDEKKVKQSENEAANAQITEIEKGIAALDANLSEYEAGSSYLEENEAEYITDKDAYSFSKTALDQKAADFAEANDAGLLDAATAAATQAQLDTLNAQLDMKKASLDQYEAVRAKVVEYETAKTKVELGLAALSEKDSVKTKILGGMDTLTAAKEALKEDAAKEDSYLQIRFYINVGTAAIALLILFAALTGLSVTNIPSIGKIRGGLFFGFISFIASASAIVYCILNNYSSFTILIAALAVEAFFSFLYIVSVIRYKNTLLELIAD